MTAPILCCKCPWVENSTAILPLQNIRVPFPSPAHHQASKFGSPKTPKPHEVDPTRHGYGSDMSISWTDRLFITYSHEYLYFVCILSLPPDRRPLSVNSLQVLKYWRRFSMRRGLTELSVEKGRNCRATDQVSETLMAAVFDSVKRVNSFCSCNLSAWVRRSNAGISGASCVSRFGNRATSIAAFDRCCNSSSRTTQAWFRVGQGQYFPGRWSEILTVRSPVIDLVTASSQWQKLQVEHFRSTVQLGLNPVGGTWHLLSW